MPKGSNAKKGVKGFQRSSTPPPPQPAPPPPLRRFSAEPAMPVQLTIPGLDGMQTKCENMCDAGELRSLTACEVFNEMNKSADRGGILDVTLSLQIATSDDVDNFLWGREAVDSVVLFKNMSENG